MMTLDARTLAGLLFLLCWILGLWSGIMYTWHAQRFKLRHPDVFHRMRMKRRFFSYIDELNYIEGIKAFDSANVQREKLKIRFWKRMFMAFVLCGFLVGVLADL